MANRTSNREIRRILLTGKRMVSYRISNRRVMRVGRGSGKSWALRTKLSASQNRAQEMRGPIYDYQSHGIFQTLSDERLELFIRQPLDNGLARSEQMELVRELPAYRKASKETVADVVAWNKPGEERKCDIRWRRFDAAPGPLFEATPLQDVKVPDDKQLRALFDAWFASDCSFDCSPDATEEDNIAWRESYWYVWKRCCAAMLKSVTNEP